MNSALSAFLSNRLLDRGEGFRRRFMALAKEKVAMDFRSREEIEGTQTKALTNLLCHAADNVPFYKGRLPASDEISTANAREFLELLPIVDKETYKADPEAFIAREVSPTFDNATGGSTGTPFVFKIDRRRQLQGEASHIWAKTLAGWRPGQRVAMLWGSDADIRGQNKNWRARMRNQLANTRWYNTFDMGTDRMEAYHLDMKRFRPHLILAYAGSAFTFATFLKERGLQPNYPKHGIMTSAEVLTTAMRRRIEEVFQNEVFDGYGSREFGPIAIESRSHEGMHVNENDCMLEIDSKNPVEEPGPCLVTYLHNYAQPFIRYNTGDLACWTNPGPSSCGRNNRRLARVVGRESDTIRGPRGNLVHGEYFTHIFYESPEVKQFQFIQDQLDHARLLVIADRSETRGHEADWTSKIAQVMGAEFRLDIEYVEEIPVLPSGKYKFTVSQIEED